MDHAQPTGLGHMLKFFSGESGQDLVEYALVLPLLLALIFGTIEFGIAFFNYSTISNAAREGARAGIRPITAACDVACRNGEVDAAARGLITGLDNDELSIAITRPTATTVRVQINYNVRLITAPIINALGGQDTIAIGTTATMQLE
jgi:Flp pilus assembly protein TadG